MGWSNRAPRTLTFAQERASQREHEKQRSPWPHEETCDCLRCEVSAERTIPISPHTHTHALLRTYADRKGERVEAVLEGADQQDSRRESEQGMSDLKKILEAMTALAAVIPGANQTLGSTSINLHGCTNETIRCIVACGGRSLVLDSDTEEWDCATLIVGNVSINAHGQHRLITRTEMDADAAAAALAQAQEALS